LNLFTNPWIEIPLAIVAVLTLLRLARLRPALRTLLGPFLLATLAWSLVAVAFAGRLPEQGWLAVAILVPFVMLFVRLAVLGFQGLFRRSQGQAPPALLASVVAVVLYGIAAGTISHAAFGVQLTPFLATSAVVGAVVGLALQDTLGNLFTGIALSMDEPFLIGDWVKIGDSEGCIEQVSWRATRLRTWFGDMLTIPNIEVSKRTVLNFSRPTAPHSRLIHVGLGYQVPPSTVFAALERALGEVRGLPAEPRPVVRLIDYGDSAMQYEIRYFVTSYEDYRRVESEILRLLWYDLHRSGIEIPYPIRNVYMHEVPPQAEVQMSAVERLERSLRDIDLFRPLSDSERRAAAASFKRHHYARGERIIVEGEPGNSFFVIDTGEVEVLKNTGGALRPIARLHEGQFFGEMALLTGADRAATVVAATDADMFAIDKAGFHGVLVANPGVAVDISRILAERTDALSNAVVDVTERFGLGSAPALKDDLLKRIRSYFGL